VQDIGLAGVRLTYLREDTEDIVTNLKLTSLDPGLYLRAKGNLPCVRIMKCIDIVIIGMERSIWLQ
jgi:hypothetical protein